MKLSIIISIYNSHEALSRQIKYFSKMDLPDDVEFIFADDGSNPPLMGKMKNLTIVQTKNKLAWTQGLGRNLAVSLAKGEYLLMTDIDHILSKEAILAAREFTGDRMNFKRYFGVLLEDGTLTQDIPTLIEYGFDSARLPSRKLYASVHGNTFAIKKSTFDLLNGYDKRYCTWGFHPVSKGGDDVNFNHRWNWYAGANDIQLVYGPDIYMFPIGRYHINRDFNPKGLFHNLSQEKQDKFYKS